MSHPPAISEATELSKQLIDFLRSEGYSIRKIAKWDLDTRLYHDMGLYGELAEDVMEDMALLHHVDMSGFEFDKFFPPESPGEDALDKFLLSLIPFAGYLCRRRQVYEPLTLDRIQRALLSGRWV